MSYIDRIVAMELETADCGCGGRCAACRRRRRRAAALLGFEAASRQPVEPRPGTPPGPLVLPEWRGWHHGARLDELVAAARRIDQQMAAAGAANPTPQMIRAVPRHLWIYFQAQLRLYRIAIRGQPNPVDIGMTPASRPGFRIYKHFVPRSQILSASIRKGSSRYQDLRKRVRDLSRAFVHLSEFRPALQWARRGDRRYLHAFEIVLQRQERAATYNPKTWTFED